MDNTRTTEMYDACPYCEAEAGGIICSPSGDDSLDYCHECEIIIEGETIKLPVE